MIAHCGLICISLMINDVEQIFMGLSAICKPFLEKSVHIFFKIGFCYCWNEIFSSVLIKLIESCSWDGFFFNRLLYRFWQVLSNLVHLFWEPFLAPLPGEVEVE